MLELDDRVQVFGAAGADALAAARRRLPYRERELHAEREPEPDTQQLGVARRQIHAVPVTVPVCGQDGIEIAQQLGLRRGAAGEADERVFIGGAPEEVGA